MIALGIRYLCGWAAATAHPSDNDPEWPPHPARVYMALAAAHFETRDDLSAEEREAERAALEWLESQPPPMLRAGGHEKREIVTTYVPVNDVRDSLQVLPDRRPRQPRTFPRAILEEEIAWLMWPNAEGDGRTYAALDALCSKVTRIGHSSSLVQVWVENQPDELQPTLIQQEAAATMRLRVPAPGLLGELETLYPTLRPSISVWAGYGTPAAADLPGTNFDPRLLAFRLVPDESPYGRLALPATATVVDYFRRAVISATHEPVPEYVSGHQSDGSPSSRAHAAFIPLAFVGDHHADGHLLGLGVALPRELPEEERRRCMRAIATLVSRPGDREPGKLVMGRLGRWRLEHTGPETRPATLRPETWTGPAAEWASVTPVVFDRFAQDDDEKCRIVADSCEHVGLPRPAEVRLSHVSPLRGAPPSPAFGPLPGSKSRPTRPFTHVLLLFRRPNGASLQVRGPVLIGAGRYRGYGVCRPFEAGGRTRA